MAEVVELESVPRLESFSTLLFVDGVLEESVQISVGLLGREDRVRQLLVQTSNCVAFRGVVAHRLQVFVDEFAVVRPPVVLASRLLGNVAEIVDVAMLFEFVEVFGNAKIARPIANGLPEPARDLGISPGRGAEFGVLVRSRTIGRRIVAYPIASRFRRLNDEAKSHKKYGNESQRHDLSPQR